jgi:hypothetical protein
LFRDFLFGQIFTKSIDFSGKPEIYQKLAAFQQSLHLWETSSIMKDLSNYEKGGFLQKGPHFWETA